MNHPSPHSTESPAASSEDRSRWLTIPNVLSAIRLVGSVALVGIAIAGWRHTFLGLFVFLVMTDWVDGKLAILLRQRTVLGARIDSVADAAMYGALLIGGWCLGRELLLAEWIWIACALISYAVTSVAGLWKFGRWPSYHTRAAKTSWFLVSLGAVALLGGWTPWPFRIAMAAVTLTNLEATLITQVLPTWQVDVPSLYHALKRRSRIGQS